MTAREFLSRAFKLEKEIEFKTKLLESLKSQTACTSPVISDLPRPPHRNGSIVESTALRIVSLENEIEAYQEELEKVRDEIVMAIRGVGSTELETLLEMRYLCYLDWGEISARFGYASNYIFRKHREALRRVRVPT